MTEMDENEKADDSSDEKDSGIFRRQKGKVVNLSAPVTRSIFAVEETTLKGTKISVQPCSLNVKYTVL